MSGSRKTPTGGQYWNLMNGWYSTGTTTWYCQMSVTTNARPFGLYFQFETEGNYRYPSGSYIRIWNLKFGSSKSDEAILSPYEAQSSCFRPQYTSQTLDYLTMATELSNYDNDYRERYRGTTAPSITGWDVATSCKRLCTYARRN